jgi:nitrite reductase (NADH) small subunit
MNTVKSIELQTDWIEIGPLEAVPRLGARVIKTSHGDIAIFRSNGDEVFALDDRCPHRGGPLSQGIVTGCQVICPLHDWCIRLDDGCAEAPDEGHANTYPVRVDNGRVYLSLPVA